MFDGFKIMALNAQFDELTNNDLLEFEGIHNEKTGEVANSRKSIARYNGLTFLIHRHKSGSINSIELLGSIHKFANAGRHNYDDFTAYRLLRALSDLHSALGINPTAQELNNLEFGVNIELPFPVKKLLDSLICFKGKPFQILQKDGMDYYQVIFSQYILKIYDKSRQYGLDRHILRFEIKVIKMAFLHGREDKIMIRYLSDLLSPDNYPKLGSLLSEYFAAILFDGPTGTGKDCELVMMGRNWKYWQRPKGMSPTDRKKLERDEAEFRRLVRSEHQWVIGRLLAEKWKQLTAVTPEMMSQIYRVVEHWQCRKFTDPEDGPLSQIYPLSIVSICDKGQNDTREEKKASAVVENPKKKKVTGRPIDDRGVTDGARCKPIKGGKWMRPKVIHRIALTVSNDEPPPLPRVIYVERDPKIRFSIQLNSNPLKNGLHSLLIRARKSTINNEIGLRVHFTVEDILIRREDFEKSNCMGAWIKNSNPEHEVHNAKLARLMVEYEELYYILKDMGEDPMEIKMKNWKSKAAAHCLTEALNSKKALRNNLSLRNGSY